MNQAQRKPSDEANIPCVEPDISDEPKTNPRIRVPQPEVPEDSGVIPRIRAGGIDAQRVLLRLRFAPAVVIGALLGSAPYLLQEHARARSIQPQIETSQLAAATPPAAQPAQVESSRLAAATPPAAPPAPQPPPAVMEFEEEPADERSAAPVRSTRSAIEHAMLQRARTLLRNGDAIGAQLTLERIARRAPHGSLLKQRKLLEIQALEVIGGKSAARRAASDFAKSYPNSPELTKLSGLLL